MRIKNFNLNNRVIAFVEHGIEKADQNIMTLFGTKDFFESIVGFRIYEAHIFCWLFPFNENVLSRGPGEEAIA
jgi:hypothetical protein